MSSVVNFFLSLSEIIKRTNYENYRFQYRQYHSKYFDEDHFDIHIEYIASPNLNGKTLILTDTMLATGASMEYAYEALLTKGTPAHIHIASVIASRQAVEHIQKVFPEEKTSLWCGTIDPELNAHSYIVPGLGDAGDLCYGEKE